MLPLFLLELAFGQLVFHDMLVCVRVPFRGFSCCFTEAIVMTSGFLLSHASLVFVRAGPRPDLFFNHMLACVCVLVWAFSCCLIKSSAI